MQIFITDSLLFCFIHGLIWCLFQSKYKQEGLKEASLSLYSVMPETLQTQHAREASELQSEVEKVLHYGVFHH